VGGGGAQAREDPTRRLLRVLLGNPPPRPACRYARSAIVPATAASVLPERPQRRGAVAAAALANEPAAIEPPRGRWCPDTRPAAADWRTGGAGTAAGRGTPRHRRCAGSDAIRAAAGPRFAAQCAAAGEHGTAAERCGGR